VELVTLTGALIFLFVMLCSWPVDARQTQAPSAGRERARAEGDESKIARGRYLVRTTGCNDCHTPGYTTTAGDVDESQWLTGSSLGFQGPWGTTYPANLRQLMRRMSVDAWIEYARRPTRPPMPWFALRDMNDEDLEAIYVFVRSLGPSTAKVPAYAPPGQRVATAVVRFPDGPHGADAPAE